MRIKKQLIAAAILAAVSASASAQYTWQRLEAAPGAEYTWRKLNVAAGAEYTWRKVGGATGPVITVSANTANLNIHAAAGSPAGPVAVTVIVSPGVYVYSDGPALPALTTAGLAAGSTVTITNNGSILGAGGKGGDGSAGVGQAGGDAINLTVPASINNTNGAIFGGGGGGGAGNGSVDFVFGCAGSYQMFRPRGGGGGGGAGYSVGPGGAGGPAGTITATVMDFPGNPGAAGTLSAGGGGGTGGAGYWNNGATGGTGGAPGNPGAVGGTGYGSSCSGGLPTGVIATYLGGAGGAAGYAVRLNGNSVSWSGGNNASQVKGSVL